MSHITNKIAMLFLILITFEARGEANFLKNMTTHDKPLRHEEIKFEDSDGKMINTESMSKNIVILYFFASWCEECIKELEQLENVKLHYKKESLIIVPISEDYKLKENVLKAIGNEKKEHLAIYFDKKNKLLKQLNIFSLPTSLILNEDGDELIRIVGRVNWKEPYILALLTKYIDKIKEKN